MGLLARRDWERGVYTTYTYGGVSNELTAVDYSDSTPDVAFTYDRMGRQKTVTDAAGERTFTYNSDGSLDGETFAALTSYIPHLLVLRSYSTAGRYTGFQASSMGPGNVVYTVPNASYAYDSYGRLQSVGGDGETTAYAYATNSDLVDHVSLPNDLTTFWSYESTIDLVHSVDNWIGASVSKYVYTNDSAGRRTSVQKTGTAFSQSDTVEWAYDGLSQLASADAVADADYDYDFTYDPIGNRKTSVTRETGTPVTSTYTANSLNQYTAVTGLSPDPAHDADGNMLANGEWTYTWDAENRLVSAQNSTARHEYVYDYLGRRIERRTYDAPANGTPVLGETRRFLYDGWHLVAEYRLQTVDGDTKPALVATHLWGIDLSGTVGGAGGVGGLLRTRAYSIAADGALVPGARYYPAYDANGNVSEYLDGSGAVAAHYEYSPFGRYTAGGTAAALPFTFSTKYADLGTGLYYYGYRYYSPMLGRWISRDPLGEDGGEALYVFIGNAPVGSVDLMGLTTIGDILDAYFSVSSTEKIWLMDESDPYTGIVRSWKPVQEAIEKAKNDLQIDCAYWAKHHKTDLTWKPGMTDPPVTDPNAADYWVNSPPETDPTTAKKAYKEWKRTGVQSTTLRTSAIGSFGIYVTVSDVDCCKRTATMHVWMYNAMDSKSFSLLPWMYFRVVHGSKQARQYMWWNWSEKLTWTPGASGTWGSSAPPGGWR